MTNNEAGTPLWTDDIWSTELRAYTCAVRGGLSGLEGGAYFEEVEAYNIEAAIRIFYSRHTKWPTDVATKGANLQTIAELEAARVADAQTIHRLEMRLEATNDAWRVSDNALTGDLCIADETIAQLRAQVKQQDSDWLAMLRAVAAVSLDNENEWAQADDAALLEEFDPWQSLRELKAQVAAQGEWMPLADDFLVYVGRSESMRVCAGGKILNVVDDFEGADLDVELPDDIRLCRRTQPGGEGDNA